MKIRYVVFFCAALFLGIRPAWTHGVLGSVEKKGAVTVRFRYAGGEPLSYAQFSVFGPGRDEIEHQNGRLDANGYFAFVPDRAGRWRILVSDGMGHRSEKILVVGEAAVHDGTPVRAEKSSYTGLLKPLLGLSLVSNLFFLLSYAAKKMRKENGEKERRPRRPAA